MLKLKAMGKKRLFIGIGAVLLLCALVGVGYVVFDRIKNGQQDEKDLTSVLTSMPPVSTPDDNYVNTLSEYLKTTDDKAEKAKGYKTLADAYKIKGDFKNAHEAYKSAKEFEAYGNFTDEEKTVIDNNILATESQISASTDSSQATGTPFKEPDE